MKNKTTDIYEMLDTLSLPVAAQRFAELSKSPEFGSYTALQFIREVLEPQYIETLNNRFETNLRLSSLINKGALAENLKTGNGRIYNDATVDQILKFHFAENTSLPNRKPLINIQSNPTRSRLFPTAARFLASAISDLWPPCPLWKERPCSSRNLSLIHI